MTCFFCPDRKGLISMRGLELTGFLCGGPKRLDFSVEIEADLVIVRGLMTCFFSCGSIMTCS